MLKPNPLLQGWFKDLMRFKPLLKTYLISSFCLFITLFSSAVLSQNLTLLISGSVKQTGVIESIAQQFQAENSNVNMEFRYGSSLKLFDEAKKGDVDIVISHYPVGEHNFKQAGFAALQAKFMYNKFVIMGPKNDQLQLASKQNVKEVLLALSENEVDFYASSRFSGTKKHLDQLWRHSSIAPDWLGYEATILSGPNTMKLADKMGYYTFVDMGSYAVNKPNIKNITPLFRDDIALNNYYTITVVNTPNMPQEKQQLAEAFFHYLTSAKIQKFIQEYGATQYGLDLYTPYAIFDETVIKLRDQDQSSRDQMLLAITISTLIVLLALYLRLYELRKINISNQQKACKDHLTKIGNRRLFNMETSKLLREKSDFALMLMDLCKFKQINDQYGHDCGDTVIQQTAKRLETLLSKIGRVYRLGGDEFVIIIHNTSKLKAEMLTSIIHSTEANVYCNGNTVSVSPSIGIVYSGKHGFDLSTLLRKADQAMYESKNNKINYLECSDLS